MTETLAGPLTAGAEPASSEPASSEPASSEPASSEPASSESASSESAGVAAGGPVAGPDGLLRCPWGVSTADYLVYHDEEWGQPVRDTVGMFERLSLEAFQSGLSWLTILRKRAGFRRAFADFDPAAVAAFGPGDTDRLMADASIVRNRRKIEATVTNARAILALDTPIEELVWSFQPDPANRPVPRSTADLAAKTPESLALSKALRRHGLVFVGPTTAYAMMQACGLVNDHLADCVARGRAAA